METRNAQRGSTVLVTTSGCGIIIFDEGNPLVTQAILDHLPDKYARLRVLEVHQELLLKTVILDGTFRVDIDPAPIAGTRPVRGSSYDSEPVARLRVPTGVVSIWGGSKMPVLRLVEAEAGIYEIAWSWSGEEESKHYGIDAPSLYPANDGPDGIMTISRVV